MTGREVDEMVSEHCRIAALNHKYPDILDAWHAGVPYGDLTAMQLARSGEDDEGPCDTEDVSVTERLDEYRRMK